MNEILIQVLLVEDNPADVVLFREMLIDIATSRFQVAAANSLAQAGSLLARPESFDVILLDLSLPDSRGLATVGRIQALAPGVAVVVLTGMDDESTGVQALRAGAQDYLVKGQADARLLARAIRYAIERKRQDEMLRIARDQLEQRVREQSADLQQVIESLQVETQERQNAQERLSESEQRYRRLFQAVPIGIAITSLQGRAITCNPAMENLLGITLEQLRSVNIDDFYVHPEQRAALVARVEKTGSSDDTEILMRRHDGQTFYGLLSLSLIRLGGQPLILSLLRDISERKEAQRRSDTTKALLGLLSAKTTRADYLDSVVELIRDWAGYKCVGIRVIENDGRLEYASQTGFSAEFLAQEKTLYESDRCVCVRLAMGECLPHERDLVTAGGSFLCNDTRALVERMPAERMADYRSACARAGYRSVAVVPVRYRGQTLGLIHLADDEPDRIPSGMLEFIETIAPLVGEALVRFNMEEELRRKLQTIWESGQLLERVFSNIQALVAYLDKNFNYIRVNRRYAQAYGRAVDFFAGKNHFQEYPDAEYRRILQRVIAGGEAQVVHEMALSNLSHPGGGQAYWDWTAAPVRGIDGRVEGLVVSMLDVTQRKRLEQDLMRIAEDERQRIGRDLHDSLGQSLTGLAFLSRALQKNMLSQCPDLAAQAELISQHLHDAITMTRGLARGLRPVELKADGLMAALQELAATTETMFHMRCHFQCDQPVLLHDSAAATHMYRIAQEATSNAIRHGRAKSIEIELSDGNNAVLMTIADDGAGFDPAAEYNGMGLRIMQYRAKTIGAVLEIAPRPQGGMRVSCQLSLPKAN